MKKLFYLFSLVLLSLTAIQALSQTINLDGYAYLEIQSNHDSILVYVHRTAPSQLDFYVYTNQAGYFSVEIPTGIYDISYSKEHYYSQSIKEEILYSNKTLDPVTLISAGLSGRLSGVLKKGNYIVGDSIWVEKNDTLTIEAGTKLFFKKDKGLTVFGYLMAIGTEQDSIIFTRYLTANDNSDSIWWKGIVLFNDKFITDNNVDGSIFKYCSFSYCRQAAIKLDNSKAIIRNILIQDCYGYYGLAAHFSNFEINDLKILNFNAYDTISGGICLYLWSKSKYSKIYNIEITGIKNKKTAAIGNFEGVYQLNNVFVHDNLGGAVSNYAGTFTFNNSTFVNNKSFFITFDHFTIMNNCIIANNTDGGITNNIFNSVFNNNGNDNNPYNKWVGVYVTTNKNGDSCDVYGNIKADPKFVDAANHDYHLQSNSPCIDAGVNDSVWVAKDLDGNARIWDGNNDGLAIVDMGVFEYGAPPVPKTQKILDENCETTIKNWTISQTSGTEAWSLLKDKQKTHTGNGCMELYSKNGTDSWLITPQLDFPAGKRIDLSLWLNSGIIQYNTQGQKITNNNGNFLIKLSTTGKQPSDFKALINEVDNLPNQWKNFSYDLSDYAGQKVYLAFEGVLEQGLDLFADDITVEANEKTTDVEDYKPRLSDKCDLIKIYPNPCDGIFQIQSNDDGMEKNAKIYDMFGNIVYDGKFSDKAIINIRNNPSGYYVIQIIEGKNISFRKFIKL